MDELAKKLNPVRVTFQPLKLIVEPDFGPQEPMQTAVIKANVEADFDKLGEKAYILPSKRFQLKIAINWKNRGKRC